MLVRLRQELLGHLQHLQGPRLAEAARETASEPDADGWVTVTLQFEYVESAAYDLMRFGGDLEVLEPVDLREQLASRAAQMVERYASVPA